MGTDVGQVHDPNAGKDGQGGEVTDRRNLSDEHKKVWTELQGMVGMDVTSMLSVPVWVMEPTSVLQKMAEIMENSHLLDSAANCEDPMERMAWIAAFCTAVYGSSERTWKPFNPILGETLQIDLPGGGRYLSEQVSHHPPIGVGHGETDLWEYDITSTPKTKFLGNSLEVYPLGRTRIRLKTTGEVFSLLPPNSKAYNLIVGSMWVDTFGEFKLNNVTTGAHLELEYKQCGWFGAGRYEVDGFAMDADGTKKLRVYGKWNEFMSFEPVDAGGEVLPDSEATDMWTCAEKPEGDGYGFTKYVHDVLNRWEGPGLLRSDSRLRPDRAALEAGDSARAQECKHLLEEKQRAEKTKRVAEEKPFALRWFEEDTGHEAMEGEYGADECPAFKFKGKFPGDEGAAGGNICEVDTSKWTQKDAEELFRPWQFVTDES